MADTTSATLAPSELNKTPLDDLHRELGGKMVPFAGYALPVNYAAGILAEHLHTRAAASLFDVSHMGQVALHGAGAAAALETLLPGDIAGLAAGRMRYSFLTNERGGILDDLMVTNAGDHLFVVVNAARKRQDIAHITAGLGRKAACRAAARPGAAGAPRPQGGRRPGAPGAGRSQAPIPCRRASRRRWHSLFRYALGLHWRGRV